MTWLLDHGTYRWRAPSGAYYRVRYQGGKWTAAINRARGFPVTVGVFARLVDAKAACLDRERNAAGTTSAVLAAVADGFITEDGLLRNRQFESEQVVEH